MMLYDAEARLLPPHSPLRRHSRGCAYPLRLAAATLCRRALTFAASLLLVASGAQAMADESLVVWINGDKGFEGVARVGERFTEQTGLKVLVETPESLTDSFDRTGGTLSGPDIVIWAHDRFGSWINEGFLVPVEPSAEYRKTLTPQGWEAVTVGDRLYGYPIAIEAVSLIYNKELVQRPPVTLEQLIALDRQLRPQGRRAIEWDYNNLYFSWPFIAGAGGFSFRKESGVYDLTQVGVGSAGAIAGVGNIRRLLESGVLDPGADYGSMMDKFKRGEAAMIINGPWAWKELREAGLDIGLAAIPGSTADQPGRPFVGVMAAAINSGSRKKAEAQDFLENHLVTYEGLSTVDADRSLGAVAHLRLIEELRRDPAIDHTYRYAQGGELMPDFPEMKRFWMTFEGRFADMLAGRAPIEPTLRDIAERLRRLDAIRGWVRRHYLVGDGEISGAAAVE